MNKIMEMERSHSLSLDRRPRLSWSRVSRSVTDWTWDHYSLPPRVDFCRVEEVDPALVGDSHQLLRHLTRRRSFSSVYKYYQSCASKEVVDIPRRSSRWINVFSAETLIRGNCASCRLAPVVYSLDCFDPLPVLEAYVETPLPLW